MRCELSLNNVTRHIEGSYLGLSRFWLDRWQALSMAKAGLGRKNNE
jgi:hypothetical protein